VGFGGQKRGEAGTHPRGALFHFQIFLMRAA
jgi:hypothetical protein